jgi:cysteine-rich repeat protein
MKTPPKKSLLFLLLSLPFVVFGCAGELGCGDGLLQTGELCDDANTLDNDGCSALCLIETGTDCGTPPTLAPNAKLQGCDLSGLELSGVNLEGADLNGANLIGANLSNANLKGAILERAGLLLTNVTGADLTEAALGEANLTRANLTDANLTLSNLADANISDVDLTRADLTDVVGQPINAATAIYNNTICPSGLNSNTTKFTCIDQGF